MSRRPSPFPAPERGAITLFVVVMLLVFVIIMAASIQYISRQANQVTNSEIENQAIGIADTGVQYTLWLLDREGGNLTPTDLIQNKPPETVNHAVADNNNKTLGSFTINYDGLDASGNLSLHSYGQVAIADKDICQTIAATISPFIGGVYRITSWSHLPGNTCPGTVFGCTTQPLPFDVTHEGNLTGSDCVSPGNTLPADIYTFDGTANQVVQIDVTSFDFNPYLALLDPNNNQIVRNDSTVPVPKALAALPFVGDLLNQFTAHADVSTCDYDPNLGACIAPDGNGYTLPETGTYKLVVGTLDPTTGVYELNATDVSGTPTPTPSTSPTPTPSTSPTPTPLPACSDGNDNDGDGRTDYPNDFDCTSADADSEQYVCSTYHDLIIGGSGSGSGAGQDCYSPADGRNNATALFHIQLSNTQGANIRFVVTNPTGVTTTLRLWNPDATNNGNWNASNIVAETTGQGGTSMYLPNSTDYVYGTSSTPETYTVEVNIAPGTASFSYSDSTLASP